MEWIRTDVRLPERVPNKRYSQVPCLVWYRGEVTVLVFNHEHMVWDDDSGDDYECDIGAVSHWMPLPSPPTTENVEGSNTTVNKTRVRTMLEYFTTKLEENITKKG